MIYIVYEDRHLDEAKKKAEEGCQIICLNYLLERECKKRNITYVPLRRFVDAETGEDVWWKLSHDISREWYRLQSMDFFIYKGIRVAEAPEPIMQAYLAKIFYYVRIFLFLKKALPGEVFDFPQPESKSMSYECLASFQPWAVLDAALMAGLVKSSAYRRITPASYVFERENKKSRIFKLYNALICLVPRKKHKIYLSGYWPHAESLVPLLDDTEVIILETKLAMDIPWRQLLKHRIKFKYSHGPVSPGMEKAIRVVTDEYLKKWISCKNNVESYLKTIREDLNWSPIIDAFEHIIAYSPRVVADIDILFEIMKTEKPDVVLQMASVGGPHHYFFLLARVAHSLGIPSVELQHATVTNDPRSVFCRIETDYLLTYGEHINAAHRAIGNGHKQLVPVGSPRFDRYVMGKEEGEKKGKELFRQMKLDPKRPVLLVAVPFSETYASAVDSYLLQEFLETVAAVQKKTPGLQIVFKCRIPKLVGVTQEYVKELFSHDYALTGEEDIFPFICASDAVLCNNSTVIYQAVLTKKPLVLYPWKRFDSYHADLYAKHIPLFYESDEAVKTFVRIFSDPSFRAELMERQEQFLKGYMFDGRSSERVAQFLKNLAL